MGMRNPRQKDPPAETDAYYHLITRTVAGEFLFGDVEKEQLRKHLWLVAERCGIEIITYAVMSNHLHIVVHAPKQTALPDRELLRRYALLHGGFSPWQEQELEEIRAMLAADGEDAAEWRAREMRNMGDISAYMKLVKQRYSIWYNITHKRFGTLWAERFRSVQLEPGDAVARTAAYVDINPVRAKIVDDPKDYRFCGYAEAVAGSLRAQRGIGRAMGTTSWVEAQRRYRVILFVRAARRARKGGAASAEVCDGVIAAAGELALPEQLRCRCRYFTDGAVLGSQAFVLKKLQRFRKLTGRGKKMQPQAAGGPAAGFAVLHKLWTGLAPG